uniref:Uncharacterized protein n=1 Tax=Rhizophora mucronata TaxID=61149 RepID=A0A2P2PPF2_RHIMU
MFNGKFDLCKNISVICFMFCKHIINSYAHCFLFMPLGVGNNCEEHPNF